MKIEIENIITITMTDEDREFLTEARKWAKTKKEEVWNTGYSVPNDLWELLEKFQDVAIDLKYYSQTVHNLEHCAPEAC